MNRPGLSWFDLTMIKISGMICLPVLMVGAELGHLLGPQKAFKAILIGNLALFLLGLINCSMAFKNKKNTIENAALYFGDYGAKLFSLNMVMVLLGWFAIQLNVISLAVLKLVQINSTAHLFLHGLTDQPIILSNIVVGIFLTLIGLFKMDGLKHLAFICTPLLLFTIIYSVWASHNLVERNSISIWSFAPNGNLSLIAGIAIVIATAIAAVVDLPTFVIHARDNKSAQIALFIAFMLAMPLLQFSGTYVASIYSLSQDTTSSQDLVSILGQLGGISWKIWVSFFILFAGWTINSTNLYSASVAIGQLFNNSALKNAHIPTLICGALGTLFACMPFIKELAPILNIMGILVGSMGSVILGNYLLGPLLKEEKSLKEMQTRQWLLNLISWAIGCLVGFMNLAGLIELCQAPMIDAFIVSFICASMAFLINIKFR